MNLRKLFELDKLKHISVAFLLCSILEPLSVIFFNINGLIYSSLFILLLFFAKEVWDKINNKFIDWMDILVGVLSWLIYTIFLVTLLIFKF